jgi:hypothetical protein
MASVASAAPLLHDLFQDHVVLQRDRAINVWGMAQVRLLNLISPDAGASACQA